MANSTGTQTGTQVPAAGNNFPPFDTTTFGNQLLWLALVFGALYFVIAKIVTPRISGILENRASKIAADLKAAEEAKAKADEAVASLEKSLADARANSASLAAKTRAEEAAKSESLRKAKEEELTARIASAEAAIAAGRGQALAAVKNVALEAAKDIVQRLTGKLVTSQELQAALSKARG
jgi:F-type H+-transporting ATPase subunit b